MMTCSESCPFFFRSILSTVGLLCLLSLGVIAQESRKIVAEDVHSHVLNAFLKPLSKDSKKNMLVVSQRARKLKVTREFKDERLRRLARKSKRQLKGQALHEQQLSLAGEVEILKSSAINQFFKGYPSSGWKEFYQQYPAAFGIIRMSKPVFSRKDNLAMIYVSYLRGPRYGSGELWVISLGEELRTVQVFPLWVS
mgnify:CR=1 FL=1